MIRALIRTALAWASGALPPGSIRYAKAAIAIAMAILVFWLLSTFVLTIDQLQSEWIRWIYIGLAATLTLAAIFAVRHVLREEKLPASDGALAYPAPRPSAERIKELYAKHHLDQGETTVSSGTGSRTGNGTRLRIAVAGMPDVGKTALTRRLAASLSGAGVAAELSELPPLSAMPSANRDQAELAAALDIVVLATDQDMRDYEMAFLDAVHGFGLPVIVAVTKSERLSARERAELATALERRLSALKPPVGVVFTSAEPLPLLVEVTAPDGITHVAERARSPDVKALLAAVATIAKRKR